MSEGTGYSPDIAPIPEATVESPTEASNNWLQDRMQRIQSSISKSPFGGLPIIVVGAAIGGMIAR